MFLAGSTLSIAFRAPTLRDADARVPLATSSPSMAVGVVYAATFASLGMTFSPVGSLAAGGMWCLIALLRSPRVPDMVLTRPERVRLFLTDLGDGGRRTVVRRHAYGRYVLE